jgi:uncharacterized membrane protein
MASTDVEAAETIERRESGTGLDRNVAGALSYLLGIITGAIMFVVEKDDEYVRWHAAQSIGVSVVLFGVSIVVGFVSTLMFGLFFFSPTLGAVVGLLFTLVWGVFGLALFGMWLYLMWTAYQGKRVRVPLAARIADALVD